MAKGQQAAAGGIQACGTPRPDRAVASPLLSELPGGSQVTTTEALLRPHIPGFCGQPALPTSLSVHGHPHIFQGPCRHLGLWYRAASTAATPQTPSR